MRTKGTLGCALLLSCLAACSGEPTRAPAAPAPAPAAPAPAPAPPPASSERLPLAERLRREATQRPEAREQVEQLLQGLTREDVELVHARQVLAAPLGADYCAAALSARGLGLSLCAFGDAARAERGLQYSHATFDRLIPGRTLLRGGAALLTLTRAPGPESAAESARVARHFTTSTGSGRASL